MRDERSGHFDVRKREEELTEVYHKLTLSPLPWGKRPFLKTRRMPDPQNKAHGRVACRDSLSTVSRAKRRAWPAQRCDVDVMQHTVSIVIHSHCGQAAML